MTKQEYAKYVKYEAAVARVVKGLEFVSTGACPGCEECGLPEDCSDHERELADEAHFSWQPCECCGSTLGGNRHPAHGRYSCEAYTAETWIRGERHLVNVPAVKDKLVHLNVCTDCLYYLNYGQLDDATMMEIES